MLLFFLAIIVLVISLVLSWKYFNMLFDSESYSTWFFHEEEARLPNPFIRDKISFTIVLPELLIKSGKNIFPINVYGHVTIGFLFYYFLKIQKDYGLITSDEVLEEKQGWRFYSLSNSGKRKGLINPELTLRENRVNQHGIIEAVILSKKEHTK